MGTGSTVEQLRRDINQGRTGDKVGPLDPAAAPLGTDEEAAGTPIDPAVVDQVRCQEARYSPPNDDQRSSQGDMSGVYLWVAVVAVLFSALFGSILLIEL